MAKRPNCRVKGFTHRNDGFICENCGKLVPPLKIGCRNHCPFCLVSKHVDINPGDRESMCLGLMDPITYELDGKKGVVLVFRCRNCKEIKKNKAVLDNPTNNDNYDLILKISALHAPKNKYI